MFAPAMPTGKSEDLFEIQALESLPCGCVAGAYQARGADLVLIAVEAKGPHCSFGNHSLDSVLRVGELDELEPDPDTDESDLEDTYDLLGRPGA